MTWLTRTLLLLIAVPLRAQNFTPQLPQVWVNGLEYLGTTSNTINFPASGSGGAWTCPGGSSYGPYTAGSAASLQTALNDAEACRNTGTNHPGTTIVIPAGVLYSSANGLSLPQTAGDAVTNTNFIILTSTNPLPVGQTACSHGLATQDNVPASVHPALRNLGCNGSNLSYQLGTTITQIPAGPFTYANGTAANTNQFNDVAHMYTIETTASNQSAISTVVDSNNVGSHHFAILNGEFRPQAGIAGTTAPWQIGAAAPTLQSQIPIHLHFAYDYLHGDMTDATISGGVVTAPPAGGNSLANGIALNGCIYCSFSYLYTDKILRPGSEGHIFGIVYAMNLKFVHNWLEGSSINHFCGGVSSTYTILGFQTCENMEERGNRFTYSRSWNLAVDGGWNPNTRFLTSGGTGTGASVHLTVAWNGWVAGADIEDPGSGYTVGDILTMLPNLGSPSATGGKVEVTAIGAGGAVTTALVTAGSGYSLASGLPTTVTTTGGGAASGTGATVNITQVGPSGSILGATLGAPGSGYAGSNILTVVQPGGSGGTIRVMSITGTPAAGTITAIAVASGSGSNPGYYNQSFYKKNTHEEKAGSYVLMDGNVFENNDNSGVQGVHFSLKSSNTSNTNQPTENYWLGIRDITVTSNIGRQGCQGTSMGTRSQQGAGWGATLPVWRILYQNNLLYDIDNINPGCGGVGTTYGIRLPGVAYSIAWIANAQEDASGTIATYTLTGGYASATLATCTTMPCPGLNQSTIAAGDTVLVYGCSGGTAPTAFNMSGTSLGALATTGTLTQGLTVVLQQAAPANATATGCTLSYGQGWPNLVRMNHNSLFLNGIGSTNRPALSIDDPGTTSPMTMYLLARNVTWTNDISINGTGLSTSPYGEGTRTQTRALDPATQTVHHIAMPGRDTGVSCPGHTTAVPGGIDICYSAFDDNHAPITPPSSTLFGTSTGHCVGNDPSLEDCMGIVGIMSATSYGASILPDWHSYRLCHAGDAACNGNRSQYAAGGARQASDATDLGADFAAIELAQTRNQYPAPGTFPDSGVAPPQVLTPSQVSGAGVVTGTGIVK